MLIAIGMVLPNGATLLEFTDQVVLAKNKPDEYITWRWDGKDPKSTYWGHYFRTIGEAAADYDLRKEMPYAVYPNRQG